MYPLHLEKQNEQAFARFLLADIRAFNRELIQRLRPILKERDDLIRMDSPFDDLVGMLETMQKENGPSIPREKLQRILRSNYRTIEAAARQKTNEYFQRAEAERTAGTRTGKPQGIKWQASPVLDEAIDRAARDGVDMLKNLSEEHRETLRDVVTTGFREGHTLDTMTREIQRITGMHENRARFWGRDQAGNLNRVAWEHRQREAGASGYIWQSMKDARVRDSHIENHGKFFTWDEGADNLQKPGARHPGDDYYCRCFPRPVFGKQLAAQGQQSPPYTWDPEALAAREADRKKVEAVRSARTEPHQEQPQIYAPLEGDQQIPVYGTRIRDTWGRLSLDDPGNWTLESISDLKSSMRKSHGISADDVIEELRGAKNSGIFSGSEIRGHIQDVLDVLPEDAIRSNRFPRIRVRVARMPRGILGSYHNGTLSLSSTMLRTRKTVKETIFHELMHWFHDDTMNQRGSGFRDMITALFNRKTEGYPRIPTGDGGYVAEDKWWWHYAGRVYPFEVGGQQFGSEVATTHFQLFADEEKLLRILSRPDKNPPETIAVIKRLMEHLE